MSTIKSVFSKAYLPDKYMKLDGNLNNSIEQAVPVSCNASSEKSQEQMSVRQSKERRGSNFEFEGGEDSKYLEEEKEYSHEPLPPISMSGARMFTVDLSNNQVDKEKSASSSKSDVCIDNKSESINRSLNKKVDDDEDCSVYEIKSDEDDEEIKNKEIFGLVESESKNGENIKTIAIFIIVFAILIFTAGICCLLVFNLSSTVAAYCIVLLAIIVVLDILVIRNIF